MKKEYVLETTPINTGKRLDQVIAEYLGISRAQAGKLCAQGEVKDQYGNVLDKAAKMLPKRQVFFSYAEPEDKPLLTPADLPILYEDEDIVLVNKPVGMAAHGGAGWQGDTVVGALLSLGRDLACPAECDPLRPGIVHRLDAGTSGAMVVAKTDLAYRKLQEDFRQRRVHKIYHCLVQGHPTAEKGTITAPIGRHPKHHYKMAVVRGGREALTHYRIIKKYPGFAEYSACSLLEITLETGRTHQIRVHMQALGHRVVGDPIYGCDPRLAKHLHLQRQWLHAHTLAFEHPNPNNSAQIEQVKVEAAYPEDLQKALERITYLEQVMNNG